MAEEMARNAPPEGFPELPDLPLGRYTDPELYRLEIDRVFRRSWLFALHATEVLEPGAYRVLDLPFAPVLVVRGEDGVLRAFVNACRHRGAPVVRERAGTARLLVCQYHSWAYDLCGALVRVPDERDFTGLRADERGLVPVRCEAWGGFVFVNLDPDAVALHEWLAPIISRYPEIGEASLRVTGRQAYEVACNWKIMAEGFLEVYHAKTIHTHTVAQLLDPRGAVMQLFPHGHQAMTTPYTERVLQSGRTELSDLPRIPGLDPIYWTANPAVGIFPNLITPLEASGFPFLVFWPTAIDHTRLELTWFGLDDGQDRPEAWEQRLARFDVVMQEDLRNLEPIQAAVQAAAHGGVPLNYQERRIWHVHAWIDKVIGEDRVPPALRVPDLLANLVE